MSMTSNELNRWFKIRSIKNTVKKLSDSLHSEVTISRPIFATTLSTKGKKVPLNLEHAIFFDCPICAQGYFVCDRRLKGRRQRRQCSSCQNIGIMRQTNSGKWSYKHDTKTIPHPDKSDW